MIGKDKFYSKAQDALTQQGYVYYDGDEDIKGKGRSHRAKPDYVACKGNQIIIGEIKSPAERPKSSSWRQHQPGDGEAFRKVRTDIADLERRGVMPPEIGGHAIIISGQLPDYLDKMGSTYDLPFPVRGGEKYLLGYTAPVEQRSSIEQALRNCGKRIEDRIDVGNDSITYIFY